MIELIAEHAGGAVIIRGIVNNNLIVTDSFFSGPASGVSEALAQFDQVMKDFEGESLWDHDFTLKHERN